MDHIFQKSIPEGKDSGGGSARGSGSPAEASGFVNGTIFGSGTMLPVTGRC